MRILPVIDLLDGLVVRAIRGERSSYRPLVAPRIAEPTPKCVGRFLAEGLGFREAYVADLDLIQGGSPNQTAWRELAEAGISLWLDAGTGTPVQGIALYAALQKIAPESRVIAGLETLNGPDALESLVACIPPPHLVFSLDLKNGKPLTSSAEWPSDSPQEIARIAVEAGVSTIILLDLADVGTGKGLTSLPLLRSLRQTHPGVEWWVGGGIGCQDDVTAAEAAGATGCLVGSAIYDGKILPISP